MQSISRKVSIARVAKCSRRPCVLRKFRKTRWTIASLAPMQRGTRPNELVALEFVGSHQKADALRAFQKSSGTVVHHCFPRAYAKRGARPNELPALKFFQSYRIADATRVVQKISETVVDHCSPRAYAKREARPNELPALKFFWMPQNRRRPRACFKKIRKPWRTIAPRAPMQSGSEAERAPALAFV